MARMSEVISKDLRDAARLLLDVWSRNPEIWQRICHLMTEDDIDTLRRLAEQDAPDE